MVDEIGSLEHKAERSLMHRYNIAHDLLQRGQADAGALAAVGMWLRFSSARLLLWNRDYNVKPREISAAQVGFGGCERSRGDYGPVGIGMVLLQTFVECAGILQIGISLPHWVG